MQEYCAEVGHTNKWNSIKRITSERKFEIFCFFTVLFTSGLWAILTFDKLAISSEGWYVVYSEMILAGKVPYRDFELVFPPLYTYLMTLITFVFGESLLAFRVLGVFLFIGLAGVSYHIFKLIFPPWIAAIVAVITIFIIQSENTFIAYDYIRFFDFFNYLAFFTLLRLTVKLYKKEQVNINFNMFMGGIFCALALLIRQSSGLIIFVYFVIFLLLLLFISKNTEFKHRNLCPFFVGIFIPIAITCVCLVLADAITPFIEMTLLSGTKGTISSILFSWIPRTLGISVGMTIFVIFSTLSFLLILLWKRTLNEDSVGISDYMSHGAFIIPVIILVPVLFYSFNLSSVFSHYWCNLTSPMFILNFIFGFVFLLIIIMKIKKKEQITAYEIGCLFFCGFIFTVGFGSGTSAALSLGQGALNFGFIIAIFLSQINKFSMPKIKFSLKTIVIALSILLLATSVSVKAVTPYEWWGLTEDPYMNANYETDIDYFRGIKITEDEKFVYEDFVENANTYLEYDDEIYCYSQIAIFYTLAGKIPNVKAPISWFDVSRDKTMIEDLEYLKHNNPKMIMFADHGYTTLEAHEKLFREGGESGHRKMYEWLLDCRDNPDNGYLVLRHYQMQNYNMYLMVLK